MCNVQVVGGETWDQRPDQPASTAVLSCQFDWNNTTVGCRLPHLLQLDLPCPALPFSFIQIHAHSLSPVRFGSLFIWPSLVHTYIGQYQQYFVKDLFKNQN